VTGWVSIAYGAALSALAAAGLVALVLRDTGGEGYFVDAPIGVLPASWQDTGSRVFATAGAALVLGLGPWCAATGRRVALTALLCGAAAFLVYVY